MQPMTVTQQTGDGNGNIQFQPWLYTELVRERERQRERERRTHSLFWLRPYSACLRASCLAFSRSMNYISLMSVFKPQRHRQDERTSRPRVSTSRSTKAPAKPARISLAFAWLSGWPFSSTCFWLSIRID